MKYPVDLLSEVPMNRLALSFLAASIAAATLAASPSAPLPAAVMRVGVEATTRLYMPLEEAVFSELGFTVEWAELPAERMVLELNAGAIDAVAARIRGILPRLYPNMIDTSEPLALTSVVAYAKSGASATLRSGNDLRRYRIATVFGQKLVESFVATNHLEVEAMPDVESILRRWSSGAFDVLLEFSDSAPYFAKQGFVPVSPALAAEPLVLVFNRRFSSLVSRWDAALRLVKAEGRYKKLLPGN